MITAIINELKHRILEMSSIVEKMISLSFSGIESRHEDRLYEVCRYERQVNEFEVDIDEQCVTILALHHPEAKDLRIILMIYKLNNDLERLGDQAVNIAESVAELTGSPLAADLPELIEMKNVALSMLSRSLIAFTNEDAIEAKSICEQDEVVDNYNRKITQQLISLMTQLPSSISSYLHLLRIAKNLERIADLSTNIAEGTIYLSQGRVIKHYHQEAELKEE